MTQRMLSAGGQPEWRRNPLVRVAGEHATVMAVVQAAARRGDLPIRFEAGGAGVEVDYAAVDLTLAVAGEPKAQPGATPGAGLGYSGLTPEQRGAYLHWLAQPAEAAPPTFQQLLLANLELALLEGGASASATRDELLRLGAAPAWQGHRGLGRTLVLAFWLAQDGSGLAAWFASQGALPADLAALAIGGQALLQVPLGAGQVDALLAAWKMAPATLPAAVVALRLRSLAAALGCELLQHALDRLGDEAQRPQPFRCQHRDLRLALPQPDLRPLVQPLLADMLAAADTGKELTAGVAPVPKDEADAEPAQTGPAHLIVEFGHSRSELFAYALRQAQKQSGFQQLMDEDRHMLYRVPFRRNEMRRFWQLWDCVQGWSSTRIYSDGNELQKWQIYPYSQYLR